MTALRLRPYQVSAISRIACEASRGRRRVLLVSPTGSGKTTIAAELIRDTAEKGHTAVFVAHRKELIEQCSARLDQCSIDHGVIQADHPRWRPRLPVQVASIATLARRMDLRDGPSCFRGARLLIIDEAHRSTAPSYRKLIERNKQATVIGLTATPVRVDGAGLGDIYRSLVVVAQSQELIADGYLLEPEIFAGSTGDVRAVRKLGGDYIENDLAAVMDRPKLVGDIVENWRRIVGRQKRTVVFAVSVSHSRHLAAAFLEAGVPAEHIDANTTTAVRTESLQRLARGEIEVLCNCSILTEGWDLPLLDAVTLARPTESLGLYLQMIGRVLRPAPGKERALVLDHAGNVYRHGWPTVSRDWVLSAEPGANKAQSAQPQACPSCARIRPPSSATCLCGFEFCVPAIPDAAPGELERVEPEPLKDPVVGFEVEALAAWFSCWRNRRKKEVPEEDVARFVKEFRRPPSQDEIDAALRIANDICGFILSSGCVEELLMEERGDNWPAQLTKITDAWRQREREDLRARMRAAMFRAEQYRKDEVMS